MYRNFIFVNENAKQWHLFRIRSDEMAFICNKAFPQAIFAP